MKVSVVRLAPLFVLAAFCAAVQARAQVVISEIMYHPVEEPAFNANGSPVLDLYEDVHEFVEIHNPGATAIDLTRWKLTGGIDYTFPSNAVIQAGEFRVIARVPTRLAAVPAYGLNLNSLFGPYTNQLSNAGETVRLRDANGDIVDAVSYSAEFPWAISADALGANQDFTGINPLTCQYRGRSLERVSFTHPANDPANWLASPFPGNPSPGKTNAVSRPIPKPLVVNFNVAQASDEATIIRNNQPVRIDCVFSATNALSAVSVEWFVDNIDVTGEPRTTTSMSVDGPPENGRFMATLPGQPDRSIVRYRFLANRGTGDETVSPRADDSFQWHAYFVTPVRTSTKPIYDCFISSNSLVILNNNISQTPKRVTTPDPPGTPRVSWNATQPAVMVHEGVVYDMQMRHHGSRYNRRASRNSFKWQFPRYKKFNGITGIFETDKGNDFIVGHNLFINVGLPVSNVRYVDLYLNNNGAMQRLEQGEFDGDMLDAYHKAQQDLNPGFPLEPTGEIYKCVGTIDLAGEGPYGRGDGRKLAKPPYWTDLQMYDWTFSLQNNGWRGSYYFKQLLDAMWVARGDTPGAPNPNLNIPVVRAYFSNYFDIDAMLTHVAVENWCCPWDHTTQNHFFWQRRSGKWCMLPWDCDAWFGRGDNTPPESSIYIGEVGDPNNNSRGPNFFKDSFLKAFREEYKQRLWLLNNTFLHPENITAMGFGSIRTFADERFLAVEAQCGFGPFQRPDKPVHLSPAHNGTALPPMTLQASVYSHSAFPAPAHAKTTWEIRAATGTYRAPIFKVTNTTNLTSLPIPFEELIFGETYYWRCTYGDADDHLSLASDETALTFGPAPTLVTLVAIDGATQWKYNQTADLTGANWTATNYIDAAWPSGAALLAVETAPLPEPIRTSLTLGRTTYYFRTRFNFPANPQGATLRLRHVVDDGCIVYLNGTNVLSTGILSSATNYSAFAGRNVTDAIYEGPFPVPTTSLVQGDNVLAVEVHQSTTNSSDIVFGLSLEAVIPAVTGTLVLNEIAAANRNSVTNAGKAPDWIELFNNSSQAIDLGGMSVSDDVLVPGKYVFPSSTVIAAQGYLVFWCDNETNAPGLHTGFGLNNKGQTVALFEPTVNGIVVRDYVTFGPQVTDLTIARVTNGTGGWQLSTPTPGRSNQAAAIGSPANLKINEWMASPASGDDWFEVFNPNPLPVPLGGLYLTDTLSSPTNTRIAALSFIAAGGLVEFKADENPQNGGDHVDFKLSANGESIYLISNNGVSVIDTVTFGAQTADVSQGLFPDGTARTVSFPATPSPGESNHLPISNVVVSEVLTHSDPPLEDAIELHNPTASDVNIGGWYLSDSLDQLKKYRIPDNTFIPAGGFKVFYEYQFNANTNLPTSFSFSSARGDDVYLSVADGAGTLTGYRTHTDFGAAQNGVSFGRFVTSAGVDFTALSQRTFGADAPSSLAQFRTGIGLTNAYPKVGPVVISEIMYHPPDISTNDNLIEEFVELHNLTGAPVPLFDPVHPANTWRLRDAVDFDFPQNVTLPARGYLLVVSFDPVTNTTARAAFQAKYGAGAVLFGPYQGKLANDRDSVELYKPDPPQTIPGPDFGFVPYVRVDRVNYLDVPPWPGAADGAGPSIQRVNASAYGNEPTNWFASGYTPGASYANNNPPTANLTSPANGATFTLPATVTIGATAGDSDGSVTKVEFYDGAIKLGEDSINPYSFDWSDPPPGTHSLSVRAYDNSGATTDSTGVDITVNSGNPGGDTDGDGIPDSWEEAHGLIVGTNDAALDPDNDRMTNWQEYIAGTDPQLASSCLKLEATTSGANLVLRFTAQENKAYTVQFRADFGVGAWQNLSNVTTQSVTQIIQMSDPAAGSNAYRWYRVVTPQVP
jgi:Big-like domain-containing protein/lamin tail-like protein/CotH protein